MPTPSWYSHRFNSATSVRLILGIIPHLPRPLVPPIGVVTTAICIACMPRERRAVMRNQRRIQGVAGWRLRRAVWRQFYGFSRAMVDRCLMTREPATHRPAPPVDPAGADLVRAALARGRGLVVLTAHLGNWEAGARSLTQCGAPVNIAMRPDRLSAAERWLARHRAGGDVRVVRVGDSPFSTLALRAALARNEIVAMQGDRMLGERGIEVTLFGAPYSLPAGPFLLASLCGAPLLPAFVVQEGWWKWRGFFGAPLEPAATGDREADLRVAATWYAATLERVVRRHPEQWFNFYDLWEPSAGEAA